MLLTIITVNRNNADGLERTIKNILGQTFSDYEYIIIDGKSTDRSLEVIKKYSDNVSYWVSEPDLGVYDAMNKALILANGDWVAFMNSGDVYFSDNTLMEIYESGVFNDKNIDVIYGNTVNKFPWGDLYTPASDISLLNQRMPFCHQSSFIRTHIAKEINFDLKYRISSDYYMFYNAYKRGCVFFHVPLTISYYEAADGISSKQVYAREKEFCEINGMSRTLSGKLKFIYIISLHKLKNIGKRCIPPFVIDKYRLWKIMKKNGI